MLIIELTPLENGAHRNQSGNGLCPPEGWAVVPPGSEEEALAYLPFINLSVEAGKIVGIAQGTTPDLNSEPIVHPTHEEQLRADVDFLAALQGVIL